MKPRTRKILSAVFSLGISFLAARSRPHTNTQAATSGEATTMPAEHRPRAVQHRAETGSVAADLDAHGIAELHPSYDPHLDGDPDPGEVVWTWVPYVEQDGRGKDRPVLIIARIDAATVAGCALSTKQHNNYLAVGRGGWDSTGRESFLNPERVLRIPAGAVRREGQILSRTAFVNVVRKLSVIHGFGY